MRTERIMLDGVEMGQRMRPLNAEHVARLAASIREIGLQTPITVMFVPEGEDTRVILVAGLHRLEALRTLGEESTEAFVIDDGQDAADLWEIDENFARAELTDAQRADHHVRREAILVRRGEVAPGGKGGDRRSTDKLSVGYAKKAAADLGVDERTVRRDLARGKNIAPDVLAEVSGTKLDKGVVLDQLARTPKKDQRAKLDELRTLQEDQKINRYAAQAVALTSAQEAAEIVYANMDLDTIDGLAARLSSVAMKDFLAALAARRIS